MSENEDEVDFFSQNVDSQAVKKKRKAAPKVQCLWTDESILKLIAAVEENACVWDARSKDNKGLVKRNAAWRLISDTVFGGEISAEQLKVNLIELTFVCVVMLFVSIEFVG